MNFDAIYPELEYKLVTQGQLILYIIL